MTTMRANPKTVTTIFAVIRTSPQILALFNRSEFAKTDTELKAMATYIGSLQGDLKTVPESRFR